MKTHPLLKILLSIFVTMHISCGQQNSSEVELSTPTSGNVTIWVEESLKSIIDSQEFVFKKSYPRAEVKLIYKPEELVVKGLVNDSVQTIIVGRKLTPEEEKYLRSKSYIPQQIESAKDGIALIINQNNSDSLLSMNQLKSLLNGTVLTWDQLNKANKLGKVTLVFDDAYSSTYNTVLSKSKLTSATNPNIFSAGSAEKVRDYVMKNKSALGFIGVTHIADRDDTTALNFMKNIRVMALAPNPGEKGVGEFYQPYQAYLAQEFYPLTRMVYTVSTEPRAGLGTGFSSFLNGRIGQRIFLKSGLAPARAPLRVIKVTK